jgi:transposase
MPFQSWTAPDRKRFELRTRARRIASLTAMQTEEKNRLHAAEYTDSSDVCNDIRVHIRFLGRRLEILKGKAFDLIQSCPELARKYARMTSVRGIAINSAIQILGELCVLAEDMTPRQWVAFAGLDPRIVQSGTSVKAPTRISKQGNRALRSALYMPALTAIRYEPNVKAFYEKLLARGKERMQGVVAVMRKLLHAIHGMLRTDTDFDGQKFYREPCA